MKLISAAQRNFPASVFLSYVIGNLREKYLFTRSKNWGRGLLKPKYISKNPKSYKSAEIGPNSGDFFSSNLNTIFNNFQYKFDVSGDINPLDFWQLLGEKVHFHVFQCILSSLCYKMTPHIVNKSRNK